MFSENGILKTFVIKTPQFKDGKIQRYHIQTGTFVKGDKEMTVKFIPLNGFVNGDHTVIFHTIESLREAIQR